MNRLFPSSMELNEQYLEKKYGKGRLTELNEVDLSRNEINSIELNTFKELKKLETLKLDYNEIVEIQFKLFYYQQDSLRNLNLNNNKLKEIPLEIRILSYLRELYLYGNMIKEIDSGTFIGVNYLTVLDLGNNAIEEIKEYLFKDKGRLKVLKLNNNMLKKIHQECFKPLISIEVIQLYDNDLTNVNSFFLESTTLPISFYDVESLNEYGYISDWRDFLDQFPKLPKTEVISKNLN